jgi:hypothetical protein
MDRPGLEILCLAGGVISQPSRVYLFFWPIRCAWALGAQSLVEDSTAQATYDRTEKQAGGILRIPPIDLPSTQVSEFMAVLEAPMDGLSHRNAVPISICRLTIQV